MNSFEKKFFKNYIPIWQSIKEIIHEHWINILDKLFLFFWLFIFIPVFLYYSSERIQSLLPFWWFEIYLFWIFFKIIYDIFDWYNDVWIITDKWIVDLDRSLFQTNMKTINFENIEWVEVDQSSIVDSLFNKWNLIVHKIWEDSFILNNASNPFYWIDMIEKIRSKMEEENEYEEEDRFEIIMDSLNWVVKEYLWKESIEQKLNKTPEEEKNEIAEKIKLKKWTIDLR